LYPEAPPVAVPTHVKNYPRFNEKEENLEPEDDHEVQKMKENMKITKEKLNSLKRELIYLKTNKNATESKLNHPIQQTWNNSTKNISTSDDQKNKIDDIVKKYSLHSGKNELMVFENIFKDYNSTNSNHVDIKKIKERIQNKMMDPKIKKLLIEDNKTNIIIRNKLEKNENLEISKTSNTRNVDILSNALPVKSKIHNGALNLNMPNFLSIK
jgi:hypothetical protein